MKRRDLLGFASMAAFWPLAAGAQQADRVRRVGVLLPFAESDPLTETIVTAIAQMLRRAGWVAGQNIRIDYRFAASDPTRFDLYAAELVALSPDAIIASNPQAVAPLRKRTRTIPIVFALMADPVGQGFVQSLARPGGNITGFSSFDAPLMGKWLQLLKEAAPNVTRVSVIFNPDNALYGPLFIREIEATAPSFGMKVTLAPVHDDAEIEEAIADHAREPGGSLVSLPSSFAASHRGAIIAAATRHRLPLMGASEVYPRGGALMSYFVDPVAEHAQAASYIDRILKGANPADLPVQQPTKYSLMINLKTAQALGLTMPQSLLQRADEVIE